MQFIPSRIPGNPVLSPNSGKLSHHWFLSHIFSSQDSDLLGVGPSIRHPSQVAHLHLRFQKTRAPRRKPQVVHPPASRLSCTASGSAGSSGAAASCPSL